MPTDFSQAIVAGVFVLWFVLSLAVYLPRCQKVVRRLDQLSLIPEWRFFAPRPGQHDLHLLYRDEYENGSSTEWTEIVLATKRRFWCAVWNPGKRNNKALFDCVQELGKHIRQGDETIELSLPYLTLLNYVESMERLAMPTAVRFAIFTSDGKRFEPEPDILLLSNLHRLST
jgi:hypothetical protein